MCIGLACDGGRGASTSALDDLLLEDLLHRALLPALVLFLRREPMAARVAHDRVARDHRPARGARDLARLALCGVLLQAVAPPVAHGPLPRDHRPARRARDPPRPPPPGRAAA